MRILWSLFLILSISLPGFGQGNASCREALYGVVTDSETMEALIYAKVYIKEQDKGVFTGENGEFRLEGLCEGEYTLTVSHIGCETQEYTIQIPQASHFDISLPHSQSHVDTVHIHDKHPGPKTTQVSEELAGRALDAQKGKSFGEALLAVNGVSALQTGSSIFKPMIHGLHSNRVLILNNGVRQEGQQWGSEHGPEIDAFIANKITVVKGANGVRYGPDAIAGVVLVEPAKLRDSAGMGGEFFTIGMSNGRGGAASGMLEGNLAKVPALSWRLQGSSKRLGSVHTPDYILGNTGVKELNYSAAVGWNKPRYGLDVYFSSFNSDLGVFSGSHFGNLTDLEQAIFSETPIQEYDFSYEIGRPFQHIEHRLLKVKSFYKTGDETQLNLTYSFQDNLRQEYDKDRPYNDSLAALDEAQLNYNVGTQNIELMWEHNRYRGFKGMMGVTGTQQANVWSGTFLIPNYLSYSGGAFVIERFVKLRWELEAGLRYDYKWLRTYRKQNGVLSQQDHVWQNPSMSLGGLYRISPHLSTSVNFGIAWRPPQVNELYSDGLHHGSAAIEVGDPNLVPETAYNLIGSLKYKNHERFSGELSLYHNYIRNFIYLVPQQPPTLTIRGAFPTFYFKQVDARLVGADMSASYSPVDGFFITGKAAILRATNLTEDDYLVLMPADRFEGHLRYEFKGGDRLVEPFVKAGIAYTRRQNRAPLDEDYAPPPPAYTLVQMAGGFRMPLKVGSLECGLTLDNATNTRYRNYLNRFRYFADEMGRNLQLRLKYEF